MNKCYETPHAIFSSVVFLCLLCPDIAVNILFSYIFSLIFIPCGSQLKQSCAVIVQLLLYAVFGYLTIVLWYVFPGISFSDIKSGTTEGFAV
jgi:hypothetical protein